MMIVHAINKGNYDYNQMKPMSLSMYLSNYRSCSQMDARTRSQMHTKAHTITHKHTQHTHAHIRTYTPLDTSYQQCK